jgi:alkylation response protein AidB-like acyl-CoA dehydrogenase
MEWLIFEEEYYRAGGPRRVSQNGIFLLAPTLFEFGTESQLTRYMSKMASGEEIWCQGWSEPDAGSDLAGIRSKATQVDGGWLLNGQKTWCSRGAFAHRCFGIFRSDPEADRHRGLTYYLIDMAAPGVTVRPIGQLDGETGFAEVFFDDVFIADEDVLGGIGEGWKVAMATAGSERGISLRSPARYTEAAGKLMDLLAATSAQDVNGFDPRAAIADEVVKAYIDAEAYKLHTYMTATKVRAGHKVGAEASATKIFWSEVDVNIHQAALRLLGEGADLYEAVERGGVDLSEWLDGYLFALSGPIYAGTNEIQRNVVAERMLGLPRG